MSEGNNIYEKIQAAKVMLQKRNIKKSGYNQFSDYNYFELADIQPAINEICLELKLHTAITFTADTATLIITNIEDPTQQLNYTSPMKEVVMSKSNAIQSLGGVETYQRRYLYMAAFDIVEHDMFDNGKAQQPANGNSKPPQASPQQPQAPQYKLNKQNYAALCKAVKQTAQATKISEKDVLSGLSFEFKKSWWELTDAEIGGVIKWLEQWAINSQAKTNG